MLLHVESDWDGCRAWHCAGPIDSIYLRMRERNRCNHRDFQNIGVNGARVGSMEKIVTGMDRNATTDKPALIFYGLIGNDVCNSNPTTERMTTPTDFKQRVLNSASAAPVALQQGRTLTRAMREGDPWYLGWLAALAYLEQTVPYNSHVLFVGLVDGRVLWDIMSTETHRTRARPWPS
jgi:acyloxyacyl hydrolase